MPTLTGQNRRQIQLLCLEDLVAVDSYVRVVDAFVDLLDLPALNFIQKGDSHEGNPAYRTADLLKLYLYGYLNRVRSSRRLMRETQVSVEAMWLLRGLRPSYRTIARFRADNPAALRATFRQFNRFLQSENRFDEDTVAVDGSKFRAQNSMKNNYNEKKIDQHLDYIDRQTDQYLQEMDRLDGQEVDAEVYHEQSQHLAQKLDQLKTRKDKYDGLKEQLAGAQANGETQISTTDPDARALPKKMNIVEVGYNVVATAEGQHKLITNFKVTNEHDTHQLADAASEARVVLAKQPDEKLTVLADKGFDTASELQRCADQDIITLVSPKKRHSNTKENRYGKEEFEYDDQADLYTCPQGERLRSNGKYYKKGKNKKGEPYRFKQYKAAHYICRTCEVCLLCVSEKNLNSSRGRVLERGQYEDAVEANKERVRLNKDRYRKRQEIIEHQFGTIKRGWGYDYTLLKGLEKVSGEFALIFTAYNLRRAITIFGVRGLIERLKAAQVHFLDLICAILSRFKPLFLDR